MFNVSQILCLLFLALLGLSCSKKSLIDSKDEFTEQTAQLSELKLETSAAGTQFLEISWNPLTHTHYKSITYSAYLNERLVVEGLNVSKFSFINLEAGKEYRIKIVAMSTDGVKAEQVIDGKTLPPPTESSRELYQEYRIHSFSTFSGEGSVIRCPDGSNIMLRYLDHPLFFSDERYKATLFKIDANGNLIWYRILSSTDADIMNAPLNVILTNQGKDCIAFSENRAFKVETASGNILLSRDFKGAIADYNFSAIFHDDSEEIIAGTTDGQLLGIHADNLNTIWQQRNSNYRGIPVSIARDKEKNIYYAVRDDKRHTEMFIYKCNSKGEFIGEFLLDATGPGDNIVYLVLTNILVDTDNNIYAFGYNSDYDIYLRYFKLSPNGTLLKKNLVSERLYPKQAFFNSKGEIIMIGNKREGPFNGQGGIFVMDKEMTIKTRTFRTEIPFHGFVGVTDNQDGTYNLFLHYITTYSYSNNNLVYIRTSNEKN